MSNMSKEFLEKMLDGLPEARDVKEKPLVKTRIDSDGTVTGFFRYNTVPGKNLLEKEEGLRAILNETGAEVTELLLESFDVDDPRIVENGVVYYNKGKSRQVYNTIYGPAETQRHIFQSAKGGRTICPLEIEGSLFLNGTPLFAKIISHKAGEMGSSKLLEDLFISHGIRPSRRHLKSVSDVVGELVREKEDWTYKDPIEIDPDKVATLSLGLDGTTMLMSNGVGYKEATVGTISFHDEDGTRLHTRYIGATPEEGKTDFLAHLEAEWNEAVARYPKAFLQGLTDGAPWIRKWLIDKTEIQLLDFYHLAEHICDAGAAMFDKDTQEYEGYTKYWCSHIKHSNDGVYKLIKELKGVLAGKIEMDGMRKKIDAETLRKVIGYLKNQAERTDYLTELENNRPIGSGVTESACKTLIKARLCQSGMRWKKEGASNIIAIRALILTAGRWEQFWKKVMRYGGYARLMGKVGE
jgi:hypothetical protein